MANSLLDFVMSLVRDPAAAAHYAADPAQAIADANLTDVTSADVNHLIPVVAESMSTVVPTAGTSGGVDGLLDSAHNVWASGAATAAFDAFDDHLPIQGNDIVADHVPTISTPPAESAPTIVDHGFDGGLDAVPSIATPSDQGPAFDTHLVDDVHVPDAAALDDGHLAVDDHLDGHLDSQLDHPQDPGFDIFT